MTAASVRAMLRWSAPVLVLALTCGGVRVSHAAEGWTWPLQPAPSVVRPFDPPAKAWSAGHRGVDLLGRPGQPVLAPLAGRVVFAADLAGRGVVVVEAGGLRATLEPVTPLVEAGTRVAAGTVLGHLQSVRSHCLPATCLHWGVKTAADPDAYLDPLSLVSGAEVVLLPFHAGRSPAAPAGIRGDLPAGGPSSSAPAAPVAAAPPVREGGGETAVRFALAQVGEPYVWAAAGPRAWDCSGLTMAAWAAAGRSLPHYSAAQYLATRPVSPARLRPGDLVFWSGGGAPGAIFHVALYVGHGQVVHAPRPGTQVRVEGMRAWAEPDYYGRV